MSLKSSYIDIGTQRIITSWRLFFSRFWRREEGATSDSGLLMKKLDSHTPWKLNYNCTVRGAVELAVRPVLFSYVLRN